MEIQTLIQTLLAQRGEATELLISFADGDLTEEEDYTISDLMENNEEFGEFAAGTLAALATLESWLAREGAAVRALRARPDHPCNVRV